MEVVYFRYMGEREGSKDTGYNNSFNNDSRIDPGRDTECQPKTHSTGRGNTQLLQEYVSEASILLLC